MKKTLGAVLICLTLFIVLPCNLAFAGGRNSVYSNRDYRFNVVSNEVYLEGKLQNGPSPRSKDIELVLNSATVGNGTVVNYNYFGTLYRGKVQDGYVIWDKVPFLVGDGTVTRTTIDSIYGGIILVFDFKMDNYKVTGKIFQALAPQ